MTFEFPHLARGIGRRLTLAFGGLALLMVASIALSVTHVAGLQRGLQTALGRDVPAALQATRLAADIEAVGRLAARIAMAEQLEETRAPQRALEQLLAATTRSRRSLEAVLTAEPGNPAFGPALRAVADSDTAWRHPLDQALAPVRTGDLEAARPLLKAAPLQDALDRHAAALSSLSAALQQDLDAAHGPGEGAQQTVLVLQWGAAAVVGLLALGLGGWLTRSLTGPATQAMQTAQRIAAGDLTQDVPGHDRDEMGRVLLAMQSMQVALREVVGSVRQNAEMVSHASEEIAAGNLDLSRRTEQQASALQQTAASMDELGSTVQHSADNARKVDQMAQGAADIAHASAEAVSRVIETMKGIDESARRIGQIIGTVDGIAFQTNILALNAAVEAARAGEHGRGFAVVAAEVRNLARRSAEAAKEIKTLVTTSLERVEWGNALVEQAGTTMDKVVTSIRKVSDVVGEISSASVEQSAGVGQVGHAVAQMDDATQRNAALVEQSAAAADSLRGQAQRLVEAVAVFRLPGGPGMSPVAPAPTPNAALRTAPPTTAPADTRTVPSAPRRAATPEPDTADMEWSTF